MTLLSRSFRPLTGGALQSFLEPFGAKRSQDFYIVRNRPPTEASISSTILARAPTTGATGYYDDAHDPRRFPPSLVGMVGEIRFMNSRVAADDDIDEFSSCSDDDCERGGDDETVEDTRRKAWLEWLDELKDYKLNHGDALVPQRYPANPSLGNWVSRQRKTYTFYQKRKEFEEKWRGVEVLDGELKEERERLTRRLKGMTEKRIQLLEAEGFVWDALEAQWFERLNEMKDYKMNHGDTLVPQRYPANPSLGLWVTTQRKDNIVYQRKKEFDEKWRGVEVLDDKVKEEMDRLMRQSSGMTEKRIQLLEAEGFVWDALEAQWFERLKEMKDYKMNHGDTLVPQRYPANPSLGLWVTTQRASYIVYQRKKEFDEKWRGVEVLDDEVKEEMDRLTRRLKGMTEKRIQLLQAEGFVWDVLEAQWFERLKEMKDYKMNHGDTLVPSVYPANPSLGLWVGTQRVSYMFYQKKKEFDEKWRGVEVLDDELKEERERLTRRLKGMTEERIQLLEAEGFVWDPLEAQWFERLKEMKDYTMNHGDTLVPQRYPANPSLGLWVTTQRASYMIYQKKKEFDEKWRGVEVLDDEVKEERERLTRRLKGMTEKRIQLLEAEGFVWDPFEAQWLERLIEMKDYKMNHGDTLVPSVYPANPSLGLWVFTQRASYMVYQKKKEFDEKWRGVEVLDDKVKEEMDGLTRQSSGMTEKRIQLLETEGFVWDVRAHFWELRFQELRAFAALNGHAVIYRRKGGPCDPLASWASTQRRNYIKRQNGQLTALTEDRIEKLNSVGFAWGKNVLNGGSTKDESSTHALLESR